MYAKSFTGVPRVRPRPVNTARYVARTWLAAELTMIFRSHISLRLTIEHRLIQLYSRDEVSTAKILYFVTAPGDDLAQYRAQLVVRRA